MYSFIYLFSFKRNLMVEDFKYLGSYKNSQHDIQCRKAEAWAAVHAIDKVWRAPIYRLTKLKIFRTTVEPILIYGCNYWSQTQYKINWMAPIQECVMAPPHDQTRTVRLPPTDHHHHETTASSSGRSWDAS